MAEKKYNNLTAYMENNTGEGSSVEQRLAKLNEGAQINRGILEEKSALANTSPAANRGFLLSAQALDMGTRKAQLREINRWSAEEFVKITKPKAEVEADAIQGPPQFDPKSPEGILERQDKVGAVIEQRGAELNLWNGNNEDDETVDQRRARLEKQRPETPEESEFLQRREKLFEQIRGTQNTLFFDNNRPVAFGATTSKGIEMGAAQALQLGTKTVVDPETKKARQVPRTYVAIKPDYDEEGQAIPAEQKENTPMTFIEVDTDWNKLVAEKEKAKADLLVKLDEANKNAEKARSLANANLGAPIPGEALVAQLDLATQEIETTQAAIDTIENDLDSLAGPDGRKEVIRMRTTEAIMNNEALRSRIPTGSNAFFGAEKLAVQSVGAVLQTGLTTAQAIRFMSGASPEEIAKHAKDLQNFEKGMLLAGFGQTAHQEGFWAKAATELPGELTQMALDVSIGYFTGVPLTKIGSVLGKRAAQQFIKQSGRAVAGMGEAAAKRISAKAIAKFEARVGRPMATFISGIPGMAEEAGAVLDKFTESEDMHKQADLLDEQLREDSGATYEGGGMSLAPEARSKMEKQRDALRKKANIIEEGMAGAFYSTMAVTGAMGYVNLDRIVKTGPKGFNVAELYMRKLARNKLAKEGIEATEDAIESEAKQMFKTLTEERVAKFVRENGGGQLKEMLGDAAVGGLTEIAEVAMNTGVANHFFKENEDVLGQDALDEGGISALVSMVTGVITGGLSSRQKKRALNDMIRATAGKERLKGEATDGMLEQLRQNGLAQFGQLEKPEEVVKEGPDGKFTIKDNQDIGTLDAPRGFFAGLTFNTREEAEEFAKDRWELAFDHTMDRALENTVNSVNEDGSPKAQTKEEIQAMKGMLRVVANSAAESGKTTTNHFFAAFLKSTQIGGNKMLGLLDQSQLNEQQMKEQDVAAAILALATSNDAVTDPKIKAVLTVAGRDAQAYMDAVVEQRAVRKKLRADAQAALDSQLQSLDQTYAQNRAAVAAGMPAGNITADMVKNMQDQANFAGNLFQKTFEGSDPVPKANALKALEGLFSKADQQALFGPDGKPTADFSAKVARAYSQKRAFELLQSQQLDEEQALEKRAKDNLFSQLTYQPMPTFVTAAFQGDTEAYAMVEDVVEKMKQNRAARLGLTVTPSTASVPASKANPGSAPTKAPATPTSTTSQPQTPAFQPNQSIEAAIEKAKAEGAEFTEEQARYQIEKEKALAGQKSSASKEESNRKSAERLSTQVAAIYSALQGRNEQEIHESIAQLISEQTDPDVLRKFAQLQTNRAEGPRYKGTNTAKRIMSEAALATERADEIESAGAPEQTTFFQTDEPAEDKSVPDQAAGFDYGLARYETDDNGVQRRIYNYEALENLLFDAVSTGEINGIPTPPGMRNPASLAMVFLRAQAYGESATRKGMEVNQRDAFRRAMIDIYGEDGRSGMAKNGKYQEIINDSEPTHKTVSIGEGMVDMLEKLRKGANALYLDEPEQGGIVADGLLPVGFFGPVAFKGVQYNDKTATWDTVTVYALVNDVYSFTDKKTGGRKRAYKMIPVPKAYAEARTVFDARARQTATLESLLNSPVSRGAVSLLDKRAEAKLRTREVIGMTLTELTEAERGAEIAKIEDQLRRGEKRLEELGTSYNELKKISEQYSAGLKALKEAAEQSQALVAEASTEASERSKNLQVAEAEVAAQLRATVQPFEDAIEKERSKETPLPWVIEANKRLIANFNVTALGRGEDRPGLTSADRAPIDAARASLAEANQKYQDALAASAADQAALSEYTSSQQSARAAVANVNFFESRKQLIEKLKGNQPIATDDILNQLSKSPAVTATVRGYAQAVMQDLNDVGIAAPALRTEVIDGVEQVVETLGEYLHRTAQMAVNGMAQMWMRSRTEDILAMRLERQGPKLENQEAVNGVSDEDMAFAEMAILAFPNYDPVMNNRNQVIDAILLQPNSIGDGYVTMPMGAMGKDSSVLMQDLVRKGEIGFTNYIENKDGKGNVIGPNFVAMVNAATNEARSRGKVIPAGGIKLIKLSDGRWIRQPEKSTSWYFLDKQYLRRTEVKKATGLTWSGTKIGAATAAAIIDNTDKLDSISQDPASIKNVIERYQRNDTEARTPFSLAANRLIRSLGPNATMPMKALRDVLSHLARYRKTGERVRDQRQARAGTLTGPKQRSGDETDGALGMTERAVTDFMEGGRYLEGTQAPEAPGIRRGIGQGTAKATFPGDPSDEMIDALLESMAVDQRMSQKKNNDAAGISSEDSTFFFGNLDTISEADDSEIAQGEEDSGTLIDSENAEDTSIYSEDSGYSTGNTDTTDHQKLVEMLKDEGLIPSGVQNLGEFTLEQWIQGRDYAQLEADEDPIEVWKPAEQREGFDIQSSEWGRRRLIPKFDHRGQLGILNPESPIRKEAKIGDIIYIQDQAYEVEETGAKFKVGPVKPMHEMIRAKKAELQASKSKLAAESKKTGDSMTVDEWMQQGNPYPRPSVEDIEGLINQTLGQSIQAATRLTEAQAIRSRMKRMLEQLQRAVATNNEKAKTQKRQEIAQQANLLMKIETAEKMQPMQNKVDRLTQKTEGKIVLNSDGRTRLQRKLVGTFWYRERVKPAFQDITSIIWDHKKDTDQERPSLSATRNLILENLGVDASMTGAELLEDWAAIADEGTDEQKQALKEARIYIGSFISWLTEGAQADGYKGNAFRDLKAQYASEIEEAKVQVVDRFQRSVPVYYDFKYMFEMYSGYHQKLDPASSRQMAGIMTGAMLEATAAIDALDLGQQAKSRERLGAIWQSGRYLYGSAGNTNQFGSMADRIRAAMMPIGWTVPYTQEGVDTSGQLDQTKPDFDGKLQRPPYSPETKGQVDWITTEKRNPPEQTSTDKKQRDANIRPYYGVFDVKRVVAPVSRKLSKKERAAKKRQGLEEPSRLAAMPSSKDIPASQRFIPSRLRGMERGGELDVTRLMTSLAVTDTILAVNPDLKQLPLEQMEAGVIDIVESNRAARHAYHTLKDQVRHALTEHDQAVPEQDPATEALFNLILNNWTPNNDRKGSKKDGVPGSGLQLNPEMTGAPETLFQGEQKNWRGRLTVGGTVPYPILELNPNSATAETFGHEVVHWLNNVRLSDGTTLLQAAMGSEGYATLMTWAENGDPPSDYKSGSTERAQAHSRVEERLANGVMAYFSRGEGSFAGAEAEIKTFANIVQRVWRQARRHYESEARADMWGTPQGQKAMAALDDLFVRSTGAKQLKSVQREEVDEVRVMEMMMKRFPGTTREEALRMIDMMPQVRKRTVTDINQPIVPSTGEGLSHDDPFTVLYQFDHTPDVAKAPAKGGKLARAFRKNAASQSQSKLWRRVLEFMASFRARGMVTEEMLDAKIYARGLRSKNQQTVMHIIDDIRGAIDRAVSITDTKNKTLEIYKQVNSYMTASNMADRLTARKQLGVLGGPRLVIAVTEARQLIDRLSMDLINEGVVHGDIAVAIGDRVGVYLHRKFPMAKGVDLVARFNTPEMKWTVNNIGNQMISLGYVKTAAEAEAVILEVLNNINTTSVSNGKINDILDAFSTSPALKSRGIKEDELAMLLAPLTGMETNPLIRITDTVRVITDKMAQHKFEADFRDAGLKQGYIGMPNDYRYGIQFGDAKAPALTSNKLAAANPAEANAKGPLQGFRTTPEVAAFYRDVIETEFAVSNAWNLLKTMNVINGTIKQLMTVNNWPTGLKNLYGGFMTYIGTGNTFKGLAEAWGTVFTIETQNLFNRDAIRKAKIDKARAIYDELAEDGLIDASQLGEFMEMAKQGSKFATFFVGGPIATDSAQSWITRKLGRTAEKYRRARTRFYLQGDLFWKVGAYFAETQNLREVYADQLKAGTITDREVKRRAARRTNLAMFSFEREPKIVKGLKAIPFMGNFISFQLGMLRARLAGFQLVLADSREALRLRNTNPQAAAKLGVMAGKRLVGLTVVHGLATQLALTFVASAFGWSEEKLKYLRTLAPKWEKEALLMPLGKFVPGKLPQYFNLSTLLPDAWHSRFAESLVGLTIEGFFKIKNGEDTPEFRQRFQKELFDTVKTASGPFADATGVTQMINAIFSNEDQYGNAIRQPHDSDLEKVTTTAMHITRMFIPGDLKTIARLGMTPQDFARVILNRNPRQLEDHEKGLMAAGLKVSTVTLDESVKYVFADKMQAAISVNAETLNLLADPNVNLSSEAIIDQLQKNKEKTQAAVREVTEIIEACIGLGMPLAEISSALNDVRVGQGVGVSPSKELKVAAITGDYSQPFTASRQGLIRIMEAAKEANDEQRLATIDRLISSGEIKIKSGR